MDALQRRVSGRRLPLTIKFAAISFVLVGLLIALAAIAWSVLSSTSQGEDELQRLGDAQSAVQSADMLHHALHADLLLAMLSGQNPGLDKIEIRLTSRNDALSLRGQWARLAEMPLPPELATLVQRNGSSVTAYVALAEELIHQALQDRDAALARIGEFTAMVEATRLTMSRVTEDLTRAREQAVEQSHERVRNARETLLIVALAAVAAGWTSVRLISHSIRRQLYDLRDVAADIASGQLDRRSPLEGGDEVGELARSVNRMAGNLQEMIERLRQGAERGKFGRELGEAMDMADDESQAYAVVARAMEQVSPAHRMELLLADSSDAHLERAAEHPVQGPSGCGVDSPFGCIAVRRGRLLNFPDSDSLNACPRLREHAAAPLSAHCVPVSFMGRALGVLHATGKPGESLDDAQLDRLTALALQAGSRIGTVRAFERTQLQASTDSLTGLPNRRAVEAEIRRLLAAKTPFTLVMCDLDRFKRLNDTFGHGAGDEALRTFADVVRANTRESDLAGRWGGEEFTFVLVHSGAEQALRWTERVRDQLAQALEGRSKPVFTASFGVAAAQPMDTTEALVRRADEALYRAKGAGRDCTAVADEAADEAPAGAPARAMAEAGATVDLRMLASTT